MRQTLSYLRLDLLPVGLQLVPGLGGDADVPEEIGPMALFTVNRRWCQVDKKWCNNLKYQKSCPWPNYQKRDRCTLRASVLVVLWISKWCMFVTLINVLLRWSTFAFFDFTTVFWHLGNPRRIPLSSRERHVLHPCWPLEGALGSRTPRGGERSPTCNVKINRLL